MKLRELCELCNVEYDKNHSKDCLDKIRKNYLVEKVPNKRDYKLIRELTAEEKADVVKYSKCNEILKDVVYVTLSLSKKYKIRHNMKDYLKMFNIVNENYGKFTYETITEDKLKLVEDYDYKEVIIEDIHLFVERINPMLNKMIKDIFKKLEAQSLIYVNKYLMFSTKIKFQDEDGCKYELIKTAQATEEQVKNFIEVQRQVMLKYGFDETTKVPFGNVRENISRDICFELGISYYYYDYELILNQDALIDIVESNEDLKNMKNKLNKEVIVRLLNCEREEIKEFTEETRKEYSDLIIKSEVK